MHRLLNTFSSRNEKAGVCGRVHEGRRRHLENHLAAIEHINIAQILLNLLHTL
jgi:hypothetical protein